MQHELIVVMIKEDISILMIPISTKVPSDKQVEQINKQPTV